MKKFVFCSVIAFIAIGIGCKSKSPANASTDGTTTGATKTTEQVADTTSKVTGTGTAKSTPDTIQPVQAVPAPENYRLVVAFISRGAGSDIQTLQNFEKWLNERPKPVKWEHTYWGREGEQSYCLKLDELSTAEEQKQFVADVRIFLGNKDLVFVQENIPCKGKR